MPNKVLLIRPENIYKQNNYPSLGLLSIATSLFNTGYDPRIINAALEKDWKETLLRNIGDACMIGVTMMTSEVPSAYEILSLINNLNFHIPVIVGGWHVRLFPEQMLESKLADYVVNGEGEEDIKNIKGDKLIKHFQPDMNDLYSVNYRLDPKIEYFITSYLTDPLSHDRPRPKRWLPYESSRGCPFECTFCANVVANNQRYRKKHYLKVVAELLHIVTSYNLNHVKIIDDNFFVDINRVRNICKDIIGAGFTWDAECRADYFKEGFLDDKTLSLCKEAGLVQLTLGLESGSQKTLDRIKKHITVEQAEYAVAKCNEHKITARCSFIIDIPGETKEDIEITHKFIRKLRKKYPYFSCGVQTFRPYPKCELTAELIKQGLWKEPKTFKEWCNKDYVRQFTAAQNVLPWQVNPKRSQLMASYEYMESGCHFNKYMVKGIIKKQMFRIFKFIAKIRNDYSFCFLPIDLYIFQFMQKRFMAKEEKRCRK